MIDRPTEKSYSDGDPQPFLQVRTGEEGHADTIVIVSSIYDRTYRNGDTAKRVNYQAWRDGRIMHHQTSMDLRSLDTMYPKVIVHSKAAEQEVDLVSSPSF
jgi:hypothetical protein